MVTLRASSRDGRYRLECCVIPDINATASQSLQLRWKDVAAYATAAIVSIVDHRECGARIIVGEYLRYPVGKRLQ